MSAAGVAHRRLWRVRSARGFRGAAPHKAWPKDRLLGIADRYGLGQDIGLALEAGSGMRIGLRMRRRSASHADFMSSMAPIWTGIHEARPNTDIEAGAELVWHAPGAQAL